MAPSKWMVRCEDGRESQFLEHAFNNERHLEISYYDAVLIGQLPNEIKGHLYVRNEAGKGWRLSPTGEEILGMDDRARQAFETETPESKEVIQERKRRLTELAKDDPIPLAYALRQLCMKPNSCDPRFANCLNLDRSLDLDRERVEKEAGEGKLHLFSERGGYSVRIMDLVHYLAERHPKHYPMREFRWTYAYRRIIAEGWQPGQTGTQAATPGVAEAPLPAVLPGAAKTKDDKRGVTDAEKERPLWLPVPPKSWADVTIGGHEHADRIRVRVKGDSWHLTTAVELGMVHAQTKSPNALFTFLLELLSHQDGSIRPDHFNLKPNTLRQKVRRLNGAMQAAFGLKADPVENSQTVARRYRQQNPNDLIPEDMRGGQYFICFRRESDCGR